MTDSATKSSQHGFPVFLLAPASDLVAELRLPPASINLFHRLIRNPRPESSSAKERECSEMVCLLLQNAPTVRRHLLGWMAAQVATEPSRLDGLSFRIDTEQPIGSKRDDLRIVAWSDALDGERHDLVWTVEIKVGASFHSSSSQLGEDGGPTPEDPVSVNQLLNYDHWLAQQQARYKAGFVLALSDQTDALPDALSCSWACMTWTGLGEQLAAALRTSTLPADEQLLAKHALGFIRDNLWRTSEMSESRLDFNDVSLIRAFAALAKDCEEKVNGLVEPLTTVIEESGIGMGKIGRTSSLFKGLGRSDAYRELATDSYLFVGIGGDSQTGQDFLSVWIETPAKHPEKLAFKASLRETANALRSRNPAWQMPSQDAESGWAAWDDLELTTPLASLLIASDQSEAVKSFVESALTDLKVTGVIDAFDRTIGRGGKSKRP